MALISLTFQTDFFYFLIIFQTYTDSSEVEHARKVLHQQKIVELDQVTSDSPDTVEVSWNIVGSRVFLQGVVIQWRQSQMRYQQFDTVTVTDMSRRRSHIVSGLSPDTEYDVFLQPYYGSVVGLPTSISTIRTKTQQISRKTEILVAEMINVTTAFIVWQPRLPSAGITGYQVLLKTNLTSLSTTVESSVSEVYLKLNPNDMSAPYQVSIAPVTVSGPGHWSRPVNLSLPTDLLPISVQPNLDEVR